VSLNVNGEPVVALAEPRTHLADFLREQCRLTGTHLGCEHGVCGACTVLIDGAPARACIAFAVGCEGSEVRTVEGFADDALMSELREAFSREHALQCGFCTPGMLIAARDLVLRVPEADERRIRVEMSGNLCRCTGFVGIVRAVQSVVEARRAAQPAAITPPAAVSAAKPFRTFAANAAQASERSSLDAPAAEAERKGYSRIEDSFVLEHPPAAAWAAFADMPGVAACLPGAEVTEHDPRSVKGRIRIRLGPMKAAFAGAAALERDDAALRGLIRGAGSDSVSGSRAKGDISYRLHAEDGGRRTRVAIVLEYSLQGPLAQFSRSGLVRDFAGRLIAEFAKNLDARLDPARAAANRAPAQLDAGAVFWKWLLEKLKRLIGR
jgi:carbon-monoxide dehydrogenase small subunit